MSDDQVSIMAEHAKQTLTKCGLTPFQIAECSRFSDGRRSVERLMKRREPYWYFDADERVGKNSPNDPRSAMQRRSFMPYLDAKIVSYPLRSEYLVNDIVHANYAVAAGIVFG